QELPHLLAGQVAGTPAFMAPEQVRGETHRLDARTDVWAIGVILYLGLTGRLPFPGKKLDEVFRAIVAADPTPPRHPEASVPRELERICLKCLAKLMSDRYESAAELADDLKGWLALEAAARETRRGRAELRLATLTALWRDHPQLRRLPSVLEWLMIV